MSIEHRLMRAVHYGFSVITEAEFYVIYMDADNRYSPLVCCTGDDIHEYKAHGDLCAGLDTVESWIKDYINKDTISISLNSGENPLRSLVVVQGVKLSTGDHISWASNGLTYDAHGDLVAAEDINTQTVVIDNNKVYNHFDPEDLVIPACYVAYIKDNLDSNLVLKVGGPMARCFNTWLQHNEALDGNVQVTAGPFVDVYPINVLSDQETDDAISMHFAVSSIDISACTSLSFKLELQDGQLWGRCADGQLLEVHGLEGYSKDT